ncbi:uncharacterized protein LOC126844623 isoform X5 [Adelges cooleyi]|uniref:uncharacterized protein LOC126844623 isoform X2 n=1 Tax=Adelges cooleyi TaxID=133065 RepID=UPI0021808353|nr:uncharacterized protein LOC126844623 isoform X2 [Adelges cooleyi]XP_050438909.1 uncharacterized protein LOC126844623 isoform X3 [Adelges cooleyi]XP_050438918.1 uncharacterized protein LOC126844623 isoform X4 [Adelges cooleyi]XP_050438928.1 uncharacterized protein LOC126844623 isoform X5 [Adelges cooleyi]
MAFKRNFTRILPALLFFVLTIVTVINARPAGGPGQNVTTPAAAMTPPVTQTLSRSSTELEREGQTCRNCLKKICCGSCISGSTELEREGQTCRNCLKKFCCGPCISGSTELEREGQGCRDTIVEMVVCPIGSCFYFGCCCCFCHKFCGSLLKHIENRL